MLSKKEYAAENSDMQNDVDIGEEQFDEFGDENYEGDGDDRYPEEDEKYNENEKNNENEGDSNYLANDSKQEKEVIKSRKWQWATPLIEGVPPSHRGGHTATLSGASIIIFGVKQRFSQQIVINAIGTLLRWKEQRVYLLKRHSRP